MITRIDFDTVQAALTARHGKGGWLWHSYDDGTAAWFPYTVTQATGL